MKSIHHALMCCASAVALGSSTVGAFAEEVQTIVITAEKRSEDLQKVPIDVTVVGSDTLTNSNLSGFSDLSHLAPSITMTAGDQPANSAAVIRGVGTFAFSIGVEPSVLAIVDDVPAGYQAQAFTDLVDIDRVEVLNGPQSTLYGKSASAGIISVTTKAPSDTFTYSADVKATSDNEQRETFSLSGPLSPTVAYRVSGAFHHYEGNVTNLNGGSKINSDQSTSLRGKLEWKPNDKFDATFTAHYNQDHAVCCGVPLIKFDDVADAQLFLVGGPKLGVADAGVVPGPDNKSVRLDQNPLANSSDYGVSAHLAYDFGGVGFLSVSAINHYKLRTMRRIGTRPTRTCSSISRRS